MRPQGHTPAPGRPLAPYASFDEKARLGTANQQDQNDTSDASGSSDAGQGTGTDQSD